MTEPVSNSSTELTKQPAQTDENLDSTKLARLWLSLGVFTLILIALIIFILENSMTVKIHYLGAHGKLSFGVAMLISAVAGILLTLLIGSLRILQLKMAGKKRA